MYKNKYKRDAWQWFSRFIRLRDTQDGYAQCITCGTKKNPKDGDAGHYISRSHNSTLFMELNVAFQCKGCNNPRWNKYGTHKAFRQALVSMYGEDQIEEMEKESLVPKRFNDAEFVAMSQYYQEEVERMLAEKGIEKWW